MTSCQPCRPRRRHCCCCCHRLFPAATNCRCCRRCTHLHSTNTTRRVSGFDKNQHMCCSRCAVSCCPGQPCCPAEQPCSAPCCSRLCCSSAAYWKKSSSICPSVALTAGPIGPSITPSYLQHHSRTRKGHAAVSRHQTGSRQAGRQQHDPCTLAPCCCTHPGPCCSPHPVLVPSVCSPAAAAGRAGLLIRLHMSALCFLYYLPLSAADSTRQGNQGPGHHNWV